MFHFYDNNRPNANDGTNLEPRNSKLKCDLKPIWMCECPRLYLSGL